MLWGDSPFGLIWAAWGGTRVEAWAPNSTKALCPPASAEPARSGEQADSALYNGMIAPLNRFSVRGALWDQALPPPPRGLDVPGSRLILRIQIRIVGVQVLIF